MQLTKEISLVSTHGVDKKDISIIKFPTKRHAINNFASREVKTTFYKL